MTTQAMRVRHGGWLAVLLLALMLWAAALPLQAAEPPPGSSAADQAERQVERCLLYTSPSPRDRTRSRMPSSA